MFLLPVAALDHQRILRRTSTGDPMSVRTEHPLAVAFGFFLGAIVADLLLIGGEVLARVMQWRSQR